MNTRWLKDNTFHYTQFQDLGELVALKEKKGQRISLCLPTLNEEATIAKEIVILKSELMTRYPLLDEIVVVDSGSTDNTCNIAADFGADVYVSEDILPDLGTYRGKGENLWKALYITKGDIIVYLDADIKNIHHRFGYGLIGPLLADDRIKYTKGFYDRPIAEGKEPLRATGGGRVTELVIRPLFSLFFPELTQILQPLSGEYAGHRSVFERLPFPIGYGIETSMLLDIHRHWGLDVIAQVDLERRVHRNQDTRALGKMAFVIMDTFFQRVKALDKLDIRDPLFEEMIQFTLAQGEYVPDAFAVQHLQRPPMIEVPAYREKFHTQSELESQSP